MTKPYIVYRDVDQTLKKNYLDDADDVMQSLQNIFTTKPGQLIFNASFGSTLTDFLFAPHTDTTEIEMYSEIIRSVTNFEPRVTLDYANTKVTFDSENHIYWLYLVFTINSLSDSVYTKEIGLKYEYI